MQNYVKSSHVYLYSCGENNMSSSSSAQLSSHVVVSMLTDQYYC